jgi:CDP-4-dehydro-6-deoxyglucose reductase
VLDLLNNTVNKFGLASTTSAIIATKVKNIYFINKGMALLTLRTPRSKTLQFMAGQDVELSFAGNTSRYPLASCHLAHFEEKQSHSA